MNSKTTAKKHRFLWLKIVLSVLLVIILVAGGYIAYVFIAYYRLPDTMNLTASNNREGTLEVGKTYTAQTYNVGYGSYPPEYSFFMDGGASAVAYSEETVRREISGAISVTKDTAPDIAFFQEVDQDGDRSRHVDQVAMIEDAFSDTHSSVYGQNYDSPYLFYPFNQPIGKAKSGLITLAPGYVTSVERFSLPIDTDFNKIIDLDRAFTATRMETSNGKQLQLINIHMSAFTPNQAVQKAQFAKLFNYIEKAYEDGDYVIVAGDYNHRLLENSGEVFGTIDAEYTWTHMFPYADLPEGFTIPTMGLAEAGIPSARSLAEPYEKGESFVTLIEGFILSPNVEAESVKVVDTGFKYSDHQPEVMTFHLKH